MAESDQEKTEQATPKRQRESREKGQVVSSKEISSAFALFGAICAFYTAGPWMVHRMTGVMYRYLGDLNSVYVNEDSILTLLLNIMSDYVLIAFPVMLAGLILGIAATVAQVGFTFSPDVLMPDFSKFNPVQGMGKFFSFRSLVEVFKSLIKIFVLGWLAYRLIKGETQGLSLLIQMDVRDIWVFVGRVSLKICLYAFLAMIIIAGTDYFYQWWQFQKEHRMTKQEVKEETRQTEGDPKIKARIRSIQIEMARRRMMAAVPLSTVIITNPTHLAVALQYESKKMKAPKVVAKGAGYIAEKIKEIAKTHHIPIVENKPLARVLFKSVRMGASIPLELYKSVAEILAYVYRLKGRR